MSNTLNLENAQVFVTTYKVGNEKGFAIGKWVELADFDSYDEFMDYCTEYAQNELGDDAPEICFSDWENIPSDMISESGIDSDVFELLSLDASDTEIIVAYMRAISCDISTALNKALDNYLGEFADHYELGYHFYESGCIEIPKELEFYFDFEKYGFAVAMDCVEFDNHYFHA